MATTSARSDRSSSIDGSLKDCRSLADEVLIERSNACGLLNWFGRSSFSLILQLFFIDDEDFFYVT